MILTCMASPTVARLSARSIPLQTSGRSSVRIQHAAAAGDIADKQARKSAEREQCRPQFSRCEIKPGVHDVNRDATYKDSPATSICPESADESSGPSGNM